MTDYTLSAGAGSYAETGDDVAFLARTLVTETRVFNITGIAAGSSLSLLGQTYPSLNQYQGTKRTMRTGTTMRYPSNGDVRARRGAPFAARDPTLIHKNLTLAQWQQLRDFESVVRGRGSFSVNYIPEGVTLPCVFATNPFDARIVPNTRPVRFNVTTSLVQAQDDLPLGGRALAAEVGAFTITGVDSSGAVTGVGDPHFANVILLLHGEGSNGGTTITDSSSYAVVPTTNNGITTSTARSKFGTSSLVVATSKWIDYVLNGNFGTGDYTVEWWQFGTSSGMAFYSVEGSGGHYVYPAGTGYEYDNSGGSLVYTHAFSPSSTGIWAHCAVSRVSGTTYLCSAGSVLSSFADTSPTNFSALVLMNWTGHNLAYTGTNVCEFRITNGVGRYSGSYTVPSAAFPDH